MKFCLVHDGPRWLKWSARKFTDRKVRGSNSTSTSRLPLSRLGQPGSIPALVLPPGCMEGRHRKGVTAEPLLYYLVHNTGQLKSRLVLETKHLGWIKFWVQRRSQTSQSKLPTICSGYLLSSTARTTIELFDIPNFYSNSTSAYSTSCSWVRFTIKIQKPRYTTKTTGVFTNQLSSAHTARIEKKSFSCSTLLVLNCHDTRSKLDGWDTARLPEARQGKPGGRGRVQTTDFLVNKYVLLPLSHLARCDAASGLFLFLVFRACLTRSDFTGSDTSHGFVSSLIVSEMQPHGHWYSTTVERCGSQTGRSHHGPCKYITVRTKGHSEETVDIEQAFSNTTQWDAEVRKLSHHDKAQSVCDASDDPYRFSGSQPVTFNFAATRPKNEHHPPWLVSGSRRKITSSVVQHLADAGHNVILSQSFRIVYETPANQPRLVQQRTIAVAEAITIRHDPLSLGIEQRFFRINLAGAEDQDPELPHRTRTYQLHICKS
ncbi:hypothetical protein T265_06039 [Opisthorchis viverrini]|uniref:Uncharacterized protein n=1 Tax=Opisthorchis viverrini TaxID=6198 RepID=A0A074ZLX6_OPIVI|nr:hypothetical protein T265_06039 [Opisthorchis viverrini]KER26757.1 hypothetical protein T265_06039 [Opisthorchis viverrini]